MEIVWLPISDVLPYEKNAKTHTDEQVKKIAESIKKVGWARPIAVDPDKVIIYGHGALLAAQLLGEEKVPVLTLDLDKEKAAAYRLADNQLNALTGVKMDIVIEELKGLDLDLIDMTGFDAKLTLEHGGGGAAVARIKLVEKFIVPPVSTLDTRQGYWQNRKKAWLDLGIEGEVGREGLKSTGSYSGTVPGYYYMKEEKESEMGRSLTHKEMEKYIPELTKNSTLATTDTGGMLSLFDPVLCEIMYRWFTPSDGAMIIDPFAGGSVRGVVAGFLGYKYKGIDLSEEQIKANRIQAEKILQDKVQKPEWFVGDALDIDKICKGTEADLIFSCPPYYDLEVYSEDPRDLSKQAWAESLKNYREIIKKSCALLKDNRFAIFTIGEVRNKESGGVYRNFVGETVRAFTDAGLGYYNEFVLINPYGSAALRAARQFNALQIGRASCRE